MDSEQKLTQAQYKEIAYQKRMKKRAQQEAEREKERQRQLEEDEHFMHEAILQAKKAGHLLEVPIGCVIVKDGVVIGRGYNRRNTDKSTLSHAEIRAIRKAAKAVGDWRLDGCTLYVTLEPCPMCAGAIEQARIDRVVYGAPSDKSGCAGTLLNVVDNPKLMHRSEVVGGVLLSECEGLLKSYFQRLREGRSERKQ
jgi:tRNA(adenine34) deaminase